MGASDAQWGVPSPTNIRSLIAATASAALLIGLTAAPVQANNLPVKIVSGWIPYWMSSQKIPVGVTNAVNNADVVSDVSPFWYSATGTSGENVKIAFNSNYGSASTNAAWAVGQLRGAGIAILPAIADAAPAKRMASVLADPAKRAAHVNEIVNLVVSNNYDGIDLDYEKFAFSDGRATWDSTRPNWTVFVQQLGEALRAQGKKLSVTIPPPCSMSGACGGNNGYYVYNMDGIAPFVDLIRIMAYDYSYSVAGPIAPYNWVRSIVQYSATVMDPQKLQIGVPTYGRFWTQKKSGGAFKLTGTCPSSSSSGAEKAVFNSLTARGSMTDADIPAFIASQGGQPVWDDSKKESYFEYQKQVTWTDSGGNSQTCTASKIMWFVGPQGILARTQLVGEFGIKGAAFWTIGGDNPEQWPLIRAYAQSLAPAVPEVAVQAPEVFVTGQPAVVTASGQLNGVPIVGAPAVIQQSAGDSWTDIATGTTGPDGAVGFPIDLKTGGKFRVVIGATEVTPEVISNEFTINIAPTVTANLKTKKVGKKGAVKVRVIARPGVDEQKIVLQMRQKNGAWKRTAGARTGPNGRAVVKDQAPNARGKYTYRVVTRPARGVLAGVSNEFTVRVR